MSTQITNAMIKEFGDKINLLASQKTSRLRAFFDEEVIHGEESAFEQIGNVEMADVASRHADTVYTDTPHSRRWITPVTSDIADLVDRKDREKINIDPDGPYAMRYGEAWGRRVDDHIINAAFATSRTGKDGTGSDAFPAGNVIARTFDTGPGLTFGKVREAKRLLDAGEVDQENRVAIIGSQQVSDLMSLSQATSRDYVPTEPLMEGKIFRWMGFTWVQTERLLVTADPAERCIFAHRDGLKLGIASDVFTSLDVLPSKRHSTQVYAAGTAGATRMESARVIEVICGV